MYEGGIIMVDFSSECIIMIFFENKENEVVKIQYVRPQHIKDNPLLLEADLKAKDMVKKKLHGVKKLTGIVIARNESQRKELLNQAKDVLNYSGKTI